jgi:Spy/CpxP family protein refolding chaperone
MNDHMTMIKTLCSTRHLYLRDLKWISVVFCIALLSLGQSISVSIAYGEPDTPYDARNPGSHLQRMVRWNTLNLDQSQASRINSFEQEWKQTYTQVYPQIIRDREELRQLLNMPDSDEERIMLLQQRIMGNEEKLRNEATHTFLKKKKILRPNQKLKLRKMMNHR